ncbi:hypothetical protein C8R47DRAFT_290439 [Mycena vitilis]|nr:hypothetical protein C8R47DRAFT_290439 [Mycena vitilis]
MVASYDLHGYRFSATARLRTATFSFPAVVAPPSPALPRAWAKLSRDETLFPLPSNPSFAVAFSFLTISTIQLIAIPRYCRRLPQAHVWGSTMRPFPRQPTHIRLERSRPAFPHLDERLCTISPCHVIAPTDFHLHIGTLTSCPIVLSPT